MGKVLVTGANGFLGSWLVRKLLNDGHDVSILARKNSDLSELKNLEFKICYGDVTDLDSLNSATSGVEKVYHLAGLIAYTPEARSQMNKVNIDGTKNVISAFQKNNCSELLYLSSVVAIGAGFTPSDILNEDSPYNIHHLNLGYFETKHAAEKIVIDACKKNQIKAFIVNPSTIYGRGDAKKGSRKTQIKVARGEMPFYTRGGVNVVAVEDVIEGIFLAMKNGKSGERYILSGNNMTIKELFSHIADEAGVQPPKIEMPSALLHGIGRVGDLCSKIGLKSLSSISSENAATATMYHWFDSSKAKNELGFKASDSRVAIKNSVMWMKENGLLK